jgi:hypothetical protein
MEWVISDDGSMGDDEGFVLFAATVAFFWFWPRFYWSLMRASSLYRNAPERLALGLTPLLSLAMILRVLLSWSDPIVRGSLGYVLLFALVGAGFMALILRALPLFGMSVRDDVVEAINSAATTVACGALLGVTLCFSGANIGVGPTIWTTIGPALLALLLFLLAWRLLEHFASCAEAITIDRDRAAGARLGGFLVATGAVFGRAAAGDWTDSSDVYDAAVHGTAFVLALAAVAVVIQRVGRPTPSKPTPALATGVLAAGGYLLASGTWVWTTLPLR